MDRTMRRRDRAMSPEKARKLLGRGAYGVLSTVGPDGWPYGIPLSYVVLDGFICFHCAAVGRKLDNLAFESRVCFTVTGEVEPVYDGGFSTYFESVVASGRAAAVEDEAEKVAILSALAGKYLPDHLDRAPADIAASLGRTAVWRIAIDHLTGKAKTPASPKKD